MEKQVTILDKVLQARDNRSSLRKLVASSGAESVSLSFNIPGYPKSNESISNCFEIVKNELIHYLSACRIQYDLSRMQCQTDEAGDFLLIPLINNHLSIIEIKSLMEHFEASHPLQRLIDVDVFDREAQPVSSGKAKKCLICNEPALVCMRKSSHTFDELRAYTSLLINDFLLRNREKRISQQVTSLATRALLTEVSVTPKPGLIDRISNGSHTDMDYYSFIASTSALSFYWNEIAQLAFRWNGQEIDETVIQLRVIGLKMEADMLQATRQTNTQKGAIFIMGFTVFAVAYCLIRNIPTTDIQIRTIISSLNKGLVTSELNENTEHKTHGHKVFKHYGKKLGGGIRQEIENGLPIVFLHALPALRSCSKVEHTDRWWNETLKDILLVIFAKNDDTNILHRSNAEVLKTFKQLAANCRAASADNKEPLYSELINFCSLHNISPGGSADLLAATCFIYWVQTELTL